MPGGVASTRSRPSSGASTSTPVVLLVSLLTAAALGAGHALTPGHGKTLMAAYLVGSRGTPIHAAGLGLSVALSHTLGILALAALVVGAQGLLPYDVVVTATPRDRGLVDRGHRRLDVVRRGHGDAGGARRRGRAHEHAHDHDHDARPRPRARRTTTSTRTRMTRRRTTVHSHDHDPQPGEHSHGGVRHSHLPPRAATISWRSLFVLGLAGGLIPSASALLILLSSIAAGRPGFGFVLVVAFGLGMALVMGGIGLTLVLARGRLERVDHRNPLARATRLSPAGRLVRGARLRAVPDVPGDLGQHHPVIAGRADPSPLK